MLYKHQVKRGKDIAALIALFLLTVLFCGLTLNLGHQWGDDFAAYLSDGIALDNGSYRQQLELNGAIINQDEPFVYVWGYSFFLALVHRLVGFDIQVFNSIIYYKIPAILFLAVWGMVLYSMFRYQFGRFASFAMAAGIACNNWLLSDTNNIQTDIAFSMLSWIALFLMQRFLARDRIGSGVKHGLLGLMLGFSIYLSYITRYVGSLLLGVLLVAQVGCGRECYTKNDKSDHEMKIRRNELSKKLIIQFVPYIVFTGLYFIVMQIMPYAKTQASDINQFDVGILSSNIKEYGFLIIKFILAFVPFGMKLPLAFKVLVSAPFALTIIIGIINTFRKEYTLLSYMAVTMISLLILPYTQGLRYMFNILPCFVVFFAHGLRSLILYARSHKNTSRLVSAFNLQAVVIALICVGILINSGSEAYKNLSLNRIREGGAYTEDVKEMYRYIQREVPVECNLFFTAARALSLNTGRMCIITDDDSFKKMQKDDYLLLSLDKELEMRTTNDIRLIEQNGLKLESVYDLETMILYRITGFKGDT